MCNAGLDEPQAGIKMLEEISITSDMQMTLQSEEALKRLLMKVKEESENAGLKLNIQRTKIRASSLITSWQIDEEKVENSYRFYFPGLHNHYGW